MVDDWRSAQVQTRYLPGYPAPLKLSCRFYTSVLYMHEIYQRFYGRVLRVIAHNCTPAIRSLTRRRFNSGCSYCHDLAQITRKGVRTEDVDHLPS